ncbi:MAG: DUF1080 domain-containing protein [Planctomycetia bacterium]|nr:DUF1080 domain-containing protein [Planctomycetia bacterium]
MNRFTINAISSLLFLFSTGALADDKDFVALFPKNGAPEGFVVGRWNDVSQKPEQEVKWEVKDGVLQGGLPRGSWLMSEKEYTDFELKYEFKLGPRGNGGLALRSPMKGDPAFDGMELQMADLRYNESAKDSELTGGIYRAIAPKKQVYKPEEWNSVEVSLRGNKLKAVLNGELIHDLNLDDFKDTVKRHDGSAAPAIKDRPRKGHIGFQELSRDGSHVMIRGAKIRELPADGK